MKRLPIVTISLMVLGVVGCGSMKTDKNSINDSNNATSFMTDSFKH